MSGINLIEVMDGLATRLTTISGLNVYGWPEGSVTPPFAVVSYPTGNILFEATFNGGSDEFVMEVHVGVGSVYGKASRTELAQYITAGSAKAVKAAIEGDQTLGGTVDDLYVSSCEISYMELGSNIYLAATFTVNIIG